MSELQLGLIAVAAVAILGVAGYNRWQERRAARAARAAFGDRGDALLQTTSPRTVASGPVTRIDPVIAPVASPVAVLPEVEFDEDVELIVSLSFEHPVDGEKLAMLAAPLARSAGGMPVRYAGTHVQTDRLEPPQAGRAYSGLHAAVLLGHRAGPLGAVEFSEFVATVQRIADALDVGFDVPDMNETLERAKALDARAAALDAQIAVNLVPVGAPWSGALVSQAAVEAGFAQSTDGQFAWMGRHDTALFGLQALDAHGRPLPIVAPASALQVPAVTLVLDVPRAPPNEKPLSTMVNVARALAARLGGAVVDDARRPVTDDALAEIETQLKARQDALRDAGFDAGSARALRLFA